MNARRSSIIFLFSILGVTLYLFAAGPGRPNGCGQNPSYNSGDLLCYKHTGYLDGTPDWANGGVPVKIGSGFSYKYIFSGRGGYIYAITEKGDLFWYGHLGFANLSNSWRKSGNAVNVGWGWNYKHVFTHGNGIIYAVDEKGDLFWYNHRGQLEGTNWWEKYEGLKMGTGFNFKHIFAGPFGVIYAIDDKGDVFWYRHEGYLTGQNRWTNNGRGVKVGYGGHNFRRFFCGNDGIIYAVGENGELYWYKHLGWEDGTNRWVNGGVSIRIGTGWDFKHVFGGFDGVIYAVVK